MENYRRFTVGPDPFGRTWTVEYRWQQTAISIRHSDSVDVKFMLMQAEEVEEKVVALMLPDLLKLSAESGRSLTDPWCMKLAALHLRTMIETDRDMEKTLVTASYHDLQQYSQMLDKPVSAVR
ncbi:MAG: hypothetical protein WKF37_05565 [Bryobacteraceae bacterium]